MSKLHLLALLGLLPFLYGCADLSELLKNEIEPPVPPEKHAVFNITEVQDKLHSSEWYDIMCQDILEGRNIVYVPEYVDNDDLHGFLTQVSTDHPEISWLGKHYRATAGYDESKLKVEFFREFEDDEFGEIVQAIDDAANDIIAKIPHGSSDYEKILFVHDYIIDNTVYDNEAVEKNEFGFWDTAYGCLVEGKAICGGYARGFQYVMKKLGIESGVVTGSNHAWNYVKADGDYYWIDVTWDDTDEDYPQHTYFLTDTDTLLYSRTFDTLQSFVPECDSTKDNYFIKSGGYFEEYDEQAVIDYISSCSDKHCEIRFGSFDAYSQALDRLIACGKLRKATDKRGSIRYYRIDSMFTLDVIL